MSRRAHNIVRLFLSGMAALFAYTVVITSRPSVAASERARAPKRAPATDQGRSSVPVVPTLPDPRTRLLRLGG